MELPIALGQRVFTVLDLWCTFFIPRAGNVREVFGPVVTEVREHLLIIANKLPDPAIGEMISLLPTTILPKQTFIEVEPRFNHLMYDFLNRHKYHLNFMGQLILGNLRNKVPRSVLLPE